MTTDELTAKLPDQFKPWAATYGPAFLAMTADEIKLWIELLVRGNVGAAYRAVIDKLPAGELVGEWDSINSEWDKANAANADRIALQKAAATAALKIMLAVALAAVGL